MIVNSARALNRELGFSESQPEENLRRAADVAALLVDAGVVAALAMIAPLARPRHLLASRPGADYRGVWCRAAPHPAINAYTPAWRRTI